MLAATALVNPYVFLLGAQSKTSYSFHFALRVADGSLPRARGVPHAFEGRSFDDISAARGARTVSSVYKRPDLAAAVERFNVALCKEAGMTIGACSIAAQPITRACPEPASLQAAVGAATANPPEPIRCAVTVFGSEDAEVRIVGM